MPTIELGALPPTPAASAPGDTGLAGASGDKAALASHRHARETWGVLGDIFDVGGSDAGASGHTADASHIHGMTETINFMIDGGGVTIVAGRKGVIKFDFPCQIIGWTLMADISGSIVVNLWKAAIGSYPPVVGGKITASAPPTITTATNASSTTLTGWTTTVSIGDVILFEVDSVTGITNVTLALQIRRI